GLQQIKQALRGLAVEVEQGGVMTAGSQELERFHRAVVANKVIHSVVTPVLADSVNRQVIDLRRGQIQRNRCQAAQLGAGVLVDHPLQRQKEQPRWIGASQAVPAG